MELTAEIRHNTWTVNDSDGGVWWPSDEASEEIDAAVDPAAKAVAVCDAAPMRGEWRS